MVEHISKLYKISSCMQILKFCFLSDFKHIYLELHKHVKTVFHPPGIDTGTYYTAGTYSFQSIHFILGLLIDFKL